MHKVDNVERMRTRGLMWATIAGITQLLFASVHSLGFLHEPGPHIPEELDLANAMRNYVLTDPGVAGATMQGALHYMSAAVVGWFVFSGLLSLMIPRMTRDQRLVRKYCAIAGVLMCGYGILGWILHFKLPGGAAMLCGALLLVAAARSGVHEAVEG